MRTTTSSPSPADPQKDTRSSGGQGLSHRTSDRSHLSRSDHSQISRCGTDIRQTGPMTYLKPSWLTKKFSSIMAGANIAERLTVTRRVSGDPQQVAVTSVNVNGVKYLVSTRGESQWVKNIRANPNVTLTVKGNSTAYIAAEVPVQERALIIAALDSCSGN
jgi:deazaflavin-dependent oxidoreductase (nitroreductase family)